MGQLGIIGECMVELQYRGASLLSRFGGDTFNTAVYFQRLAPAGWQTRYVSAVGSDELSSRMVETMQNEGLDTQLVQRLSDKLPGLYLIETDGQGERRFHYWRDQSAARFWLRSENSDLTLKALMECSALYLSGISLAILPDADRHQLFQFLQAFRNQGGQVIFDNNYRPRLWADVDNARQAYAEMLSQTDIAFLTFDDEQALWGHKDVDAVINAPVVSDVGELVIKRGHLPAVVRQGRQGYEVPAQLLDPGQVVDTTAAGDAFSAGYLACRLDGGSLEASAGAGHALAARVIQHQGAIIPADQMADL